jgi:hypothetical protein
VRNLGVLAGRLVAVAEILAAAALLVACSQVADYQSSYPTLSAPEPRAQQTMTPDQVQQATSALILDRSQLSAEAQAAQSEAAASGMTSPATTGTTPSAGAKTKP